MEAIKLKSLDDLLASTEDRIELIDGKIVRRPMARSEHGIVQNRAGDSYRVVKTISGPCRARIPPFDCVELDLSYILGD